MQAPASAGAFPICAGSATPQPHHLRFPTRPPRFRHSRWRILDRTGLAQRWISAHLTDTVPLSLTPSIAWPIAGRQQAGSTMMAAYLRYFREATSPSHHRASFDRRAVEHQVLPPLPRPRTACSRLPVLANDPNSNSESWLDSFYAGREKITRNGWVPRSIGRSETRRLRRYLDLCCQL
jgi:hypothetical protein